MWRRRAALLAIPVFALGATPKNLAASLTAAGVSYASAATAVGRRTSPDTVPDFYRRLFDDRQALAEPPPAGYDPAAWTVTTRTTARLDLQLIRELTTGTVVPMGSIRGSGETLIRSSKDATLQPVGVYVPTTYVPSKPSALIVFLHGHLQSESELLAPQYVRDLADRNNAIVVAPYGRGYYDYHGSVDDIYDALDAATRAFNVDPHRRYLIGYSMGAFSVFEVAPVHPNDWTAVMSIAGALLGSDAPRLLATMHHTPFYVLTGARDASIPTKYPTITAQYLHQQGVQVSFYSQPDGIHRLITLLPILRAAWNDMLHGIVRSPPPTFGPLVLPSAPPTIQKT